MGSWMSFSSQTTSAVTADSNPCGLNRFQRIAAFFLCIFAAAFCFTTVNKFVEWITLVFPINSGYDAYSYPGHPDKKVCCVEHTWICIFHYQVILSTTFK
jgi:hypothetical protein